MTTPDAELVEIALRAYTSDCTCNSCRKAVTRILAAITPVIRRQAMEEAAIIAEDEIHDFEDSKRLSTIYRNIANGQINE